MRDFSQMLQANQTKNRQPCKAQRPKLSSCDVGIPLLLQHATQSFPRRWLSSEVGSLGSSFLRLVDATLLQRGRRDMMQSGRVASGLNMETLGARLPFTCLGIQPCKCTDCLLSTKKRNLPCSSHSSSSVLPWCFSWQWALQRRQRDIHLLGEQRHRIQLSARAEDTLHMLNKDAPSPSSYWWTQLPTTQKQAPVKQVVCCTPKTVSHCEFQLSQQIWLRAPRWAFAFLCQLNSSSPGPKSWKQKNKTICN